MVIYFSTIVLGKRERQQNQNKNALKMSLPKLERDLCRCCHSEGSFQSLAAFDETIGKDSAYSVMLRNCLSIEMSPVVGSLVLSAFSICNTCALRLRDAHDFKQQVLRCEELFHRLYCNPFKDSVTIVKEEALDPDDDDLTGNEDGTCMDFELLEEQHDKKKVKRKKLYSPSASGKASKVKRSASKKYQTRKHDKPPRLAKVENDKLCTDDSTDKLPWPSYRLSASDYEQVGDVMKCLHCGKAFNSTNGLRFHIKTHHLNIPRYSCPVCSKPFRTMAPFIQHKYTEHGIDDRSKCNACDNIFNTKTQLMKHKNSFHMLGKKIHCELCDYECFSMEALYKHKFKHKTVKDHHCKYCRKSFLRKTTLQLHERIHTGDRRKVCAECGQAFVQKASLNYHMAKYHPAVQF